MKNWKKSLITIILSIKPGQIIKKSLHYLFIDYENIENDYKCIAQYFNDLLIDIQNNNILELELFHIELE